MTNSDWPYSFNKVALANSLGSFVSGELAPTGIRIEEGEFHAKQFSPETIAALKNALDYGDVIVKCGWCGQYGAIKTTCKHCGQAIDPV